MRYRETVTGGFNTANQRRPYSRTSCSASYTAGSISTTYSGDYYRKSISDVETPGFHRLLDCGKFLPLNPVVIEEYSERRIPGDLPHNTYQGGCLRGYYTGGGWAAQPWNLSIPAYDEGLITSLGTAAIASAKEAIWDALTTVAEQKKTYALIERRLRDLLKLSDSASKRIKGKTLKRRLESWASLWLEARFGWRPIVYDVDSAIKSLTAKVDEGSLVKGKTTASEDLSASESLSPATGPTTYIDVANSITGARTYRSAAYAEVISSNLRARGFDPFTTGWELIPFSFVIDWFVDVGSWVQAYSPFSGAKLLGCMISVKDDYQTVQEVNISFSGTDSGGVTHTGSGSYSTETSVRRYVRFPFTGGLPQWNPRLTALKYTDLAALAIAGRSRVQRRIIGL